MTTIKEYVFDKDEFKNLASTRIHWIVRTTAVICTNGGGKVITTGEQNLILSLTSITKEGHVLFLETNYGEAYPNREVYLSTMAQIREDLEKEFPEATKGAWSNGE